MAGGKETPRQKLIGLMYLVLLALLALQVSSAILQKFQFLNSSLELAISNANTANDGKISGIEKAVEKSPQYKNVLDEAKRIKDMSRKMIAEIQSYKDHLIMETGCEAGVNCKMNHKHGVDEKGAYKGLKDEDKTAHLMVGDPSTGKKGEAYGLKDRLNKFVEELNKVTNNKFKFPPLAQDGKDDPLSKDDPEQKGKDFAELNFAHTPMIAALAVLSDKQSKITAYESNVLAELAQQVGAKDFKFDVIEAQYSALSSTVAAGTDYEAKMFVTARSSAITPTMRFRGSTIKVENGVGVIKFKASASNYDAEGNSKQNWEGQVSMPKPTGDGDTTFTVKGEYIVAKPVIDVKSASVSALYYNCGNDLNIQVPALGANYSPSFSANGARIINGKDKGAIIVVPSQKGNVSITVASGGATIGTKEFPVRGVPRPAIVAKIGGTYVNQKTGVTAPGPASITVLAEPDPAFQQALPREARYSITDGKVILARGKREIATIPITQDNVNVSSIRSQAQAGDRIVIVINKARRLNFQDQAEDVPINPASSVITIPVN
jgi:gliding motility-associated protein GldM